MVDKHLKQISLGSAHSVILKETGELFVFGENGNGELGLENAELNKLVSVPKSLITDKNISQIRCGFDYSMFLKKTGKVYVFGGKFLFCFLHLRFEQLFFFQRTIVI